MPLCALKIRQKEQREKGRERNMWDPEVKDIFPNCSLPHLWDSISPWSWTSLILLDWQDSKPTILLSLTPQFWNCKEPDPTLGYWGLELRTSYLQNKHFTDGSSSSLNFSFTEKKFKMRKLREDGRWENSRKREGCWPSRSESLHPGVTPCVAMWGPTSRDLICPSSILLIGGDK